MRIFPKSTDKVLSSPFLVNRQSKFVIAGAELCVNPVSISTTGIGKDHWGSILGKHRSDAPLHHAYNIKLCGPNHSVAYSNHETWRNKIECETRNTERRGPGDQPLLRGLNWTVQDPGPTSTILFLDSNEGSFLLVRAKTPRLLLR